MCDKPEIKSHPRSLGNANTMEFQAETRKLLDIVANSLYTDKEVFIRELVSNASDALEKRRHASLTSGSDTSNLHINIQNDTEKNIIEITDNGIGMSRDDLMSNLGTIARSGSKSFMQQLEKDGEAPNVDVIGQFGVGFYSVFMVAKKVTVYSRRMGEEVGYCWSSTGDGKYELSEAADVEEGTKIVIELKEGEKNFAKRSTIEDNIKKYSNFVNFPIELNGTRVNTVSAIWTRSAKDVSEDEHKDFFKHITQDFADRRYTLMFQADAPVSIKALFYVPFAHQEKYGMARQDPSVSLYSRKVLIQPKSPHLLPEYMRFLTGVVDCEDIPLNISRETMQDSALMAKLSAVLTKRLIKFLKDQAKKEPEKYFDFYKEFGSFLKEGVVSDHTNRDNLASLLRFESSTAKRGDLVSLDDYISRMVPAQEDSIYYLTAPSRETALKSAYLEVCDANNVEVLLLTSGIDEYVMMNLGMYSGKKLIPADQAKLAAKSVGENMLSDNDAEELRVWFEDTVTGVGEVNLSSRLVNSPAVIIDPESATTRRMMTMLEQNEMPTLAKQKLEINISHPIFVSLHSSRKAQPDLSKLVAQQVFDNALIEAGLLDDPRTMLRGINLIMEKALARSSPASEGAESAMSGAASGVASGTTSAAAGEASVGPAREADVKDVSSDLDSECADEYEDQGSKQVRGN